MPRNDDDDDDVDTMSPWGSPLRALSAFLDTVGGFYAGMYPMFDDDDDDDTDDTDITTPLPEPSSSAQAPHALVFSDKYRTQWAAMDASSDAAAETRGNRHTFVMEHTPQGNCVMRYTGDRFEYYSDRVMPYRDLEVVARRLAIVSKDRDMYIDTEAEVALADARKREIGAAHIRATRIALSKIQELQQSPHQSAPSTIMGGVYPCPKYREKEHARLLAESAKHSGVPDRSNRYNHRGPFSAFSSYPPTPGPILRPPASRINTAMTYQQFVALGQK